MKKLIILILVLFTSNIDAQKKMEFIPVLTYENTKDPDFFTTMVKRGKTGEYHTKTGAVIKLRDTLILLEAYANLGKDAGYYTNIVEGDPNDGGRIVLQSVIALMGSTGGGVSALYEKPDEPVTIEIIRFARPSKKRPAKVEMLLRPIYGASNLSATYYITDVELAIKHQEIYHTSMPVSEEVLLEALKKAKSKLDLQIMSQEEYNLIKEEIVKKLQQAN